MRRPPDASLSLEACRILVMVWVKPRRGVRCWLGLKVGEVQLLELFVGHVQGLVVDAVGDAELSDVGLSTDDVNTDALQVSMSRLTMDRRNVAYTASAANANFFALGRTLLQLISPGRRLIGRNYPGIFFTM